MGAFVIYNNEHTGKNINKFFETFSKKGFIKKPIVKKLRHYNLIYYSKIKVNTYNLLEVDDELIVAIGTFIYKRKWGIEALKNIYDDIKTNNFKVIDALGDYVIIYSDKESNLHFHTSPSNNYNIFYDQDEKIISSSFLAVLEGLDENLSLNKNAIIEVLVTGNLVGPDTIIKQIKRLESYHSFKSQNLIHHKSQNQSDSYLEIGKSTKNFSNAVDYQVKGLVKFFEETKNFIDHYNLSIGITGGWDSRLFLAAALNTGINPSIYTTWRNTKNEEFLITEEIADSLNLELRYEKHKTWKELDSKAFTHLLNANFWFNDGLIRTHQLWTEEIKSMNYLNSLLRDCFINSSGVGGEQYRNAERFPVNSRINIRKWLLYEVLLKHTIDLFKKSKKKSDFIDNYINKINRILGIGEKDSIDYLYIKRYYNEIYNPANRTTRNNIENQNHYFLSPFVDFNVSERAYAAIPWLGIDFDFEKEMISRLNPRLSDVRTNYGFSPAQNVNIMQRSLSYLKAYTPAQLFWKANQLKRHKSDLVTVMGNKFPFIIELLSNVEKINLPINLALLKENSFLSPLLIELGFFIDLYKNRLK